MRDVVSVGLDPVAIRASLEVSRAQGLLFRDAWLQATGGITDEPDVVKFMMKHFRAAYHNTDGAEGRCMVPERDVSAAIVSLASRNVERDEQICAAIAEGQTYQAVADAHGMSKQRVHVIVSRHRPQRARKHERCRSGDGCEHEATHGRHGVTFCEYHFMELERVRVAYERMVAAAASRNPALRAA